MRAQAEEVEHIQSDVVVARLQSLEQRIERTGEMFQQLIKAQGKPIRLDYSPGTRYMYLVRQRDKKENTIGAYWRVFVLGADKRRIWKKGWHPKRIPPVVLKKMDSENYEIFSWINEIAKAIYTARTDLVKKKQRVLGTLQSVGRSDDPRMQKAEELLDEFVL